MRRPNVLSVIDVRAFRNREYRPRLLRRCGPQIKRVQRVSSTAREPRVIKNPSERIVWAGMIQRCNPVNGHKDYAGRGISVCERWRASFDSFLVDVGPRPSAWHSIGRLDNDGNYEPGNVEWQTSEQQQNNRRNTLWIPFRGKLISATQFSRATGIPYSRARLMAWVDQPRGESKPRKPRSIERFDEPIFVKVNIPLPIEDALAYFPCDSFEISMDAFHA